MEARARIAYLFGAFPYYSETFLFKEVKGLLERGFDIDIYCLTKARGYKAGLVQEDALDLEPRTRPSPFSLSPRVLYSNLWCALRNPLAYVMTWGLALRTNFLPLSNLIRMLAVTPKVFHFVRDMERRGVAHVHAPMPTYGATAALLIARYTALPFSFTVHGLGMWQSHPCPMIEEKVSGSAFVATISEYNRGELSRDRRPGIAGKIHVARCGIDPGQIPEQESKHEVDPARESRTSLRVLTVARLAPEKKIDVLLEACELLIRKGIDARIQVVGSGPLREALIRKAGQLRLNDQVEFQDALPHAAVLEAMNDSDLFVLSSISEGIPVVLMEAMACGLPVVATNITGIPELVEEGKAGFLVPPGIAVAMAEALEKLARDPELRRRFGSAGKEKVLSEFTTEQQVKAKAELLSHYVPGSIS